MEFVIVWIVWVVIWVTVHIVRKSRTVPAEPLCLACAHAVVTRGTGGEKCVACNFAGAMRPVKFTVCECTAFCVSGTSAKLVTIEGFAPNPREVYAEVLIS